jgi:hypothetical protein
MLAMYRDADRLSHHAYEIRMLITQESCDWKVPGKVHAVHLSWHGALGVAGRREQCLLGQSVTVLIQIYWLC